MAPRLAPNEITANVRYHPNSYIYDIEDKRQQLTASKRTMSERRPDRTTMQGMIWNANHVLDQALDPDTNGVPKSLFEKAKGLILISVIEAGFIFTGNVGTGLLLAKKKGSTWSAPSAVGMTGIGKASIYFAAGFYRRSI
jgi:lipid-binding SYLF domain-containing protein